MKTALEHQEELAVSEQRFLPQNLPEPKFRELLAMAWALDTPEPPDLTLMVDYISDAVDARHRALPQMKLHGIIQRLQAPQLDKQAWSHAIGWTIAALTAEWGHRAGYVGAPDFNIQNFDFESRQRWGAPKVPGAIARSAMPGNWHVEQLALAMDTVFDPDAPSYDCEFCNRNDMFRDLQAITEAIAAADEAIGYVASKAPPPSWRLSGAFTSLGLSSHYAGGSAEIREHCYHVTHGAVNQAQRKFARDQLVKPCGDWCDPMMAVVDSSVWSAQFTAKLEARAQQLITEKRLQPDQVAFLYAAAIERLTVESTDFDSVHIAHSVCHLLMDHSAPNPARH